MDIELFRNLCERAKRLYEEKKQAEVEYDEEVPVEFKDPIMDTIMKDPVRLPSGHAIDRAVILRHLMTVKNDPFTRTALNEEDLLEGGFGVSGRYMFRQVLARLNMPGKLSQGLAVHVDLWMII